MQLASVPGQPSVNKLSRAQHGLSLGIFADVNGLTTAKSENMYVCLRPSKTKARGFKHSSIYCTVTNSTLATQAAAFCVQSNSPSFRAGVALVSHGVVHEGPIAAWQWLGGVEGAVVRDRALETGWA